MVVKLSETEIKVGLLYFLDKLPPREIASRLGLSINTVYKAVSKVRSKLRELGVDPERVPREKMELMLRDLDRAERETRDSNSYGSSGNGGLNNSNGKDEAGNEHSVKENVLTHDIERVKRVYPGINIVTLRYTFTINIVSTTASKSVSGVNNTDRVNNGELERELSLLLRLYLDTVNTTLVAIRDGVEKLVHNIQKLADELREIANRLESAKITLCSGLPERSNDGSGDSSRVSKDVENDVPEFIRDNVWVDIIRSKYGT